MRALWLLVIAGCAPLKADEGRDALLQVSGAEFVREPLPADGRGPRVLTATMATREHANVIDRSCTGETEAAATAIAFGLVGDSGYWRLKAGVPTNAALTSPTYEVSFGLAASLRGSHQVALHAVDAEGNAGPALVRSLDVLPPARTSGRFVISLSWSNQADLDLHVVLPSGIEIFKRNRTEYQRPPPSAGPVDPNAPLDGGVLDRDSNAGCVPDGRRNENVVWKEPPPSGHYIIRVDTFSLCGAPSAPWRVEAVLDGSTVGAASGTGTDGDARFDHNRGAGVLALEVDVP